VKQFVADGKGREIKNKNLRTMKGSEAIRSRWKRKKMKNDEP